MAKKAKFDEAGDSEELQALFDSIAAAPAKPRLEVVAEGERLGDSDELQALFDSVAEDYSRDDGFEAEATPAAPADVPGAKEHDPADLFSRLGQLTRQFHEALSALGYDRLIEETARAIPDARQRLSYVAQMTEQAASRVLNATDVAKPIQERLESDAQALCSRWDRLYANELGVEEFKSLASDTRAFLRDVPGRTQATNAQLLEIMMAQDFQDLTGQVIKRLVGTAQALESQMLQLLVDFMPAERRPENEGLLNGPVVSSSPGGEVVTSQQQVDDLLDSLGF